MVGDRAGLDWPWLPLAQWRQSESQCAVRVHAHRRIDGVFGVDRFAVLLRGPGGQYNVCGGRPLPAAPGRRAGLISMQNARSTATGSYRGVGTGRTAVRWLHGLIGAAMGVFAALPALAAP